jgi:hypothetical protein
MFVGLRSLALVALAIYLGVLLTLRRAPSSRPLLDDVNVASP